MATTMKNALVRLREGVAGPELAEMATEVLEGRTDLRTVGHSSVYAAHLTKATDEFRHWQDALTPEERQTLERDTHNHLDEPDSH